MFSTVFDRQRSISGDLDSFGKLQTEQQNVLNQQKRYLDSFSQLQLQGNVQNNYHCKGYDTYEQLGIELNAAGYRVPKSANIHPCGKAMTTIFNDSIHLISSDGGALNLSQLDLVSDHSLQYKFKNLDNYLLRQWTDIQSPQFVNHFTIPYTSTKYYLMAKIYLKPDTYQLVLKNNYRILQDVTTKKILISETNNLGIRDTTLGFTLFIWGILFLCFHIFFCIKLTKLKY